MKKALLFFLIILNTAFTAYSQSASCYNDWGFWQNLNTPGVNINFLISFKQPISKKESCQYIWYRFENLSAIPDAYLMFKVDYKRSDGTVHTERFTYVKLDKTGVFTDSGNFLVGYEVVRIYDCVYKELPGKKKATTDIIPQSSMDRTNKLLNDPSKNKPTPAGRAPAMGRRADNDKPSVETFSLTNGDNSHQSADQRQQQLALLTQASRQKVQMVNNAYDGVSNLLNTFVKGMVDKSIKEHDQRREEAFSKLQTDINTKHGELIDCTDCNGEGYIKCTECDGKGYKPCIYCKETGININGQKCSQCFGNGKNICMTCDGLGSTQCYSCRGTGKKFKVDYSYHAEVAPAFNEPGPDNSNAVNSDNLNDAVISAPKNLKVASSVSTGNRKNRFTSKVSKVNKSSNSTNNTTIDKEKASEIKKWILNKLANYPGYNSDKFSGKYGIGTAQDSYSIDEGNSGDDDLVIQFVSACKNFPDGFVGQVTDKVTITFRWSSIKKVQYIARMTKDSTWKSEGTEFHDSSTASASLNFDCNGYMVIDHGDGRIKKINTKNVSFFFDDSGGQSLGNRLLKAFNDLIVYYEKNKPKELY